MLTRRANRRRLFDQLPFSELRQDNIDQEILHNQNIPDMAVITHEEWQAMQNRLIAYQNNVNNLNTAVTNLNTYNRQQVEPASKTLLNTAKPFRGLITDNWPKWLTDFNKTAQACRWNEDRKLEILPSLLIEQAEKVYNTVYQDTAQDQRTYDNITRGLTDKFNNPEALKLKASSFHQCRQTLGESAETYANRIQDLFAQAYPNIAGDDRERMILDAFTEGLQTNIKFPVMLSNATNLITTVAAARKFEVHNPLAPETAIATLLPTVASSLLPTIASTAVPAAADLSTVPSPAIASLMSTIGPTFTRSPPEIDIDLQMQQLAHNIRTLQLKQTEKRFDQIQQQIDLLLDSQNNQDRNYPDYHTTDYDDYQQDGYDYNDDDYHVYPDNYNDYQDNYDYNDGYDYYGDINYDHDDQHYSNYIQHRNNFCPDYNEQF